VASGFLGRKDLENATHWLDRVDERRDGFHCRDIDQLVRPHRKLLPKRSSTHLIDSILSGEFTNGGGVAGLVRSLVSRTVCRRFKLRDVSRAQEA